MQKALLQHRKPQNHDLVREALLKAGRADLVGSGKGKLVPEVNRFPKKRFSAEGKLVQNDLKGRGPAQQAKSPRRSKNSRPPS